MIRNSKYVWLIALFLTVFSACRNTSSLRVSPAALTLPYTSGDNVLISAHRGGKLLDNRPENCLETMDFLHEKGITMFEIDVNQAGDGTLVLFHDKSLDRTTNGTDLLKKFSYEALRTYNLLDHKGVETAYHIPRLEDVLQWAAKNKDVILQLDLKGADYEDLAELIERNEVEDQVVLIAYSLKQAKQLHKLMPALMLSVNMRNEKEFQRIMESSLPKDRLIAFTGTRLSDEALYQRINEAGIKCILGTLGNLDRSAEKRNFEPFQRYVDMGIDVLATDMPLEAYQAVGHLKTN